MGTIRAIHTHFFNVRTQLHNVYNNHKSLIGQSILKYTNKSYLLGILLVLW